MKPLTTILVLALLSGSLAKASDYASGESYTGVKIGLVSSGDVDFNGATIDQGAGLAAGLFFDQPLGSRLHGGLAIDLLSMDWDGSRADLPFAQKEMLLDIGLTAKMNLTGEESSIMVRPGAGLGLGVMSKLEAANLASSSYLSLKAFTELAYDGGGDLIYLVEAGLWYAPSGGDKTRDVKIGPLFLLRAGLMF
jgi:hypothetical protein